ncbi:synembryn-A-like [Liolophura sinensis]|uniref:synembryn-A-like n=1 Tax=Liolophura sinensis TaxID=3198878 RepID=UPI0031583791
MILFSFVLQNAQTIKFPNVNSDLRQKCVDGLLSWLKSPASTKCYRPCLETLRILSRDKDQLECLLTEETLSLLMLHAGLKDLSEEEEDEDIVSNNQDGDAEVIVEAQKCLCNLIFNSPKAQKMCSKNGCVEGIVQRLKTYKDPELKFDIKFFDMKMLFLLTALCQDTRPKIRHDMHGITYLVEVIDLSLRDAEEKGSPLTDQEVELCCEILKILFNLTVSVDKNALDEEEEAHFMRLVSVLHDLLICQTATKDKREELQRSHSEPVNHMPRDCYEELLTPLNEGAVGGMENKDVEYDGKNMEAILALLDFLYKRLDKPTKSLKESLIPILHCLCETCRSNRSIRKFCRTKVLPPLRDEVKHLPQEGDSLRNRLCKLLTSAVSEVKDLCADFLFILCKESVDRMVKYTGYGNAAGLLANRGLMLGGRGDGNYSSDSEDSETEEYSQLKEQINPVTGKLEGEKSNPCEGMTEEQKEYEAMKLVGLMDKLQRGGLVQPSRIGEDGRPVPVEHMLELTEGINLPPQARGTGDSDSD